MIRKNFTMLEPLMIGQQGRSNCCNKNNLPERGIMRKCLYCDKKIVERDNKKNRGGSNKKYCSIECRNKAKKIRNKYKFKYVCSNCGKVVYRDKAKRGENVFCDHKCQGEYRYKEENLTYEKCSLCGKGFLKKNSTHRFCSNECSKESSRKRKLERIFNYRCDNCGKDFISSSPRKGKHTFCCRKCVGIFYSKQHTSYRKCVICGKEFSCQKHEKKKLCSKECENKYRSLFMRGKNSSTYNHNIPISERFSTCPVCGKVFPSPPHGNRKRQCCSVPCARKLMPSTLTKPHIKVCDMLLKNKISYDIEHPVEKYYLDIIVLDSYFIEVMGAFWHTDVRNYEKPKCDKQTRIIKRDKIKQKIVLSNTGVNILYLWEDDINNNPSLCEKLVLKYILNRGMLTNYHSMNYFIDDNILVQNKKILIPFFEK